MTGGGESTARIGVQVPVAASQCRAGQTAVRDAELHTEWRRGLSETSRCTTQWDGRILTENHSNNNISLDEVPRHSRCKNSGRSDARGNRQTPRWLRDYHVWPWRSGGVWYEERRIWKPVPPHTHTLKVFYILILSYANEAHARRELNSRIPERGALIRLVHRLWRQHWIEFSFICLYIWCGPKVSKQ